MVEVVLVVWVWVWVWVCVYVCVFVFLFVCTYIQGWVWCDGSVYGFVFHQFTCSHVTIITILSG